MQQSLVADLDCAARIASGEQGWTIAALQWRGHGLAPRAVIAIGMLQRDFGPGAGALGARWPRRAITVAARTAPSRALVGAGGIQHDGSFRGLLARTRDGHRFDAVSPGTTASGSVDPARSIVPGPNQLRAEHRRDQRRGPRPCATTCPNGSLARSPHPDGRDYGIPGDGGEQLYRRAGRREQQALSPIAISSKVRFVRIS